ncbi:C5a peptidase [Bienertia sinuspersici]
MAATRFGSVKKRIKEAEKELKILQNTRPDHKMLSRCAKLSDELDDLHRLEESYWHSRARANELKDHDKNTSYFHHKANQRRRKNFIKGLLGGEGNWCTNQEAIANIVENYFSDIFSTKSPSNFDDALTGLMQ